MSIVSSRRLAVVTAINEEYKLIQSRMKNVKKLTRYHEHGYKSCEGLIGTTPVELVLTGMGMKDAQRVVEQWLHPSRHFGVCVMGFCGGLSAPVQVGDVILPLSVKSENEEIILPEAERDMISEIGKAILCSGHRYKAVPLLTVDHIVFSARERESFFRETGAEVVDMESSIIVKYARTVKLPVFVVKVVMDDTETDLPDLNELYKGFNKGEEPLDHLAIGRLMMEHPLMALTLRRNLARAKEVLNLFVVSIVDQIALRWQS